MCGFGSAKRPCCAYYFKGAENGVKRHIIRSKTQSGEDCAGALRRRREPVQPAEAQRRPSRRRIPASGFDGEDHALDLAAPGGVGLR